jgi:cysteine desulfurase
VIYLDNNATTRPSAEVARAVEVATTRLWANPSSVHRAGQEVRHAVELARKEIAALLGVPAKEVVLTSGGTESIDMALRGVLEARPGDGPPNIVTTRVEHAAVRDLAEHLERTDRAEVRWAPLDGRGLVDTHSLERLIDADTALVSVQWANNETGAIQPVERIAEACAERSVPFHCDAVQWVGKMPVAKPGRAMGFGAPPAPPCDLLTFSAHKFHGPKGLGGLWVRRGVRLAPRLLGTQETDRRGGTENVPGIIGAGVAAREAAAWLADPAPRAQAAAMRDRFEEAVVRLVPGAVVNGRDAPRLWNTSNIGFPRLEAEALLMLLSEQGVAASAGAACSSGSLEPSPVLLAMGIEPEVAHGSVRFSISRETDEDELLRAAEIIAKCAERLARSSNATG